jgi:hypothetical protein
MITFLCNEVGCANEGVTYNFLGDPETAVCGGCKAILIGTDLRDDPEETNTEISEA